MGEWVGGWGCGCGCGGCACHVCIRDKSSAHVLDVSEMVVNIRHTNNWLRESTHLAETPERV